MKRPTGMLSVRISEDVLDNLRNVVYAKPGMTINAYVENAIQELLRKETEIKPRPREIRSGAIIR